MIKGRLPMKYMLLFVFSLPLFCASSFITPMEYASQLYKNPRGIGCYHCHGEKGEGRIIAKYVDKKEPKSFRGPAINGMGFDEFNRALEVRKVGMPRYFLTKKEVQSLYFYLQEIKEQN